MLKFLNSEKFAKLNIQKLKSENNALGTGYLFSYLAHFHARLPSGWNQNDKLQDFPVHYSNYIRQTQTESLSLCDRQLYGLHEV
jgi:hypothetical protein